VLAPKWGSCCACLPVSACTRLCTGTFHDGGIGVRSIKLDGDERPEGTPVVTIAAVEAIANFLETGSFELGDVPFELHGMSIGTPTRRVDAVWRELFPSRSGAADSSRSRRGSPPAPW
jgi:hypothetical protein